jgi:hypothetical protein
MSDNKYLEFNNFQTAFYTDINSFEDYTLFDFKRHGYTLLNNLGKGFPALADIVLNLKGFNWKGCESPAVLKALQRKFVNNFNATRVPQFIYFKQAQLNKEKVKSIKTDKGNIFDIEIQREICSIMKIDSKTYDYLKFSEDIQFLGNQIVGEFQQATKGKKTRKTKKISL